MQAQKRLMWAALVMALASLSACQKQVGPTPADETAKAGPALGFYFAADAEVFARLAPGAQPPTPPKPLGEHEDGGWLWIEVPALVGVDASQGRHLPQLTYGGRKWTLGRPADPALTGATLIKNIAKAMAHTTEDGKPAILVVLNAQAAKAMLRVTRMYVNQPLIIAAEGRVITAPVIRSAISDRAIITGGPQGMSLQAQRRLLSLLKG